LVLAALQYAQAGEFAMARQTASHPALSPEVQQQLLSQIGAIETQAAKLGQGGKQPKTPGSQTVAKLPNGLGPVPQTAKLEVVDGKVTVAEIPPSARAEAPPEASTGPGRVVPSLAAIPDYGSDSCLEVTAVAPSGDIEPTLQQISTPIPVGATLPSVQTQSRLASLGLSLQSSGLSTLSPSVMQHLMQLRQQGTQPGLGLGQNQIVGGQPALNLAQNIQQSQVTDVAAAPFQLDRMLGSTLSQPLHQLGLTFPESLSNPVRSVFGWWINSGQRLPLPPIRSAQTLAQGGDWAEANSDLGKTLGELVVAATSPVSAQNATLLPGATVPVASSAKSTQTTPAQPAFAAADKSVSTAPVPRALSTVSCGSPQRGNFELRSIANSNTAAKWNWGRFVFPLPIPVAITSAFGWRIHPISGDRRFHAGIDFGAPSGTPALAAVNGRVVAADYMGGYGLAVVVENEDSTERNLYAHLSAIAVQPGTTVDRGSFLGWVGSTGNSTGPHLHFESHRLTPEGWVAVDPMLSAEAETAAAGN
jgi:murein DD-endopeptidase MepM/ murein hydrolase activator NlpD